MPVSKLSGCPMKTSGGPVPHSVPDHSSLGSLSRSASFRETVEDQLFLEAGGKAAFRKHYTSKRP